MILRSRYVLAGSELLDGGGVRIKAGTIVEVTDGGRNKPPRQAVDLGDCLLLPGFVNAHTHLELTHYAGRVPPDGDFVGWIRRLVPLLLSDAGEPEAVTAAVRQGRDLSLAAGVTTAGDITRLPALTRPVLSGGPLNVVSFGEVIALGRLRDRLRDRLEEAADRSFESAWLKAGVSPHAPYTLEPAGLAACAERARAQKLRLCVHLAESADEGEFTRTSSGRLREHLEACGVWDDQVPCPEAGPVELAERCGVLGPETLAVHVNYVGDDDLDRLARTGTHVVYCPRTHAAFGHPPHRFRDMLARGINVCVGTDSLVSNPSLSILDELRFLRRVCPNVAGGALVEMGTRKGARALGLEDATGVIAPGMAADLVGVPLSDSASQDPIEGMLRGSQDPLIVMIRGDVVAGALP